MGIGNNGKKVLYTLGGLTRANVATFAARLFYNHHDINNTPSDNNNAPPGRPIIYADVNNVIHAVGKSVVDPVAHTAALLKEWSKEGLIIVPVSDGETRPQSKQQSNKSRAARIKSGHDSVIQRQELRQISQQLKEGALSEGERDELEERQKKLGRSIKSLETRSINIVPQNFATLLEDEMIKISAHDVQTGGGSVLPVVSAKFEADALIKGAWKDMKCRIVMSNDADYKTDLGDDCFGISNFTGTDGKIEISSTSKEVLLGFISCLEDNTRAKLKEPDYPIYEGINDVQLRALLSVILGCDVWPGGVKGIGPKKLYVKMKELKESSANENDLYNSLMDYAVDEGAPTFNEDILTTLVKAIIFQPTNEVNADESEHTYYVDANPSDNKLPRYLEEFKNSTTIMYDGPSILECNGPCHGCSHNFLAAMKHSKCKACDDTVCHLCSTALDKTGKDQYCLSCYMMEKLLPEEDDGTPNTSHSKSIREMRRELLDKYNFNGAMELSAEEAEEAWLGYELQRQIEAMADDVRLPIYDASAIDDGDKWTVLAEIDFSNGAEFFSKEEIDEDRMLDVLELLAAFVKFAPPETKHTNWQKDGSVFTAMPEMFINAAKECRVDNLCYRLLRRCLRHTFDCRTKQLDETNKTAKLVLHEGKIGILIDAPIPASMKKDIYHGATVFTKDEILSAKCGCKSGAQKHNRNICVHSMPRGLLLSKLLAEDLAEHILLELTSMLTSISTETDNWSVEQLETAKKSVLILMEASGEVLAANEASKKKSLYDMLHHYKTGTQQEKTWNRRHGPPKEHEIGPFPSVGRDSPEQKAKELFNRAEAKPSLDPDEEVVQFIPDYVQTGIVLNASGFDPSKSEFVGYQLHEIRRNKQSIDLNSVQQRIATAQSEYESLMQEANARSVRQSATQLANLKQQCNGIASPSKRKSYELRSQVVTPSPVKKKKSGPSGAKRCAKVGCGNTESMHGVLLNRVPPLPPDLDLSKSPSTDKMLTHKAKTEFHREFKDRLGLGRSDKSEGLRVCNCHPVETIRRRVYVNDDKDTTVSEMYEMTLIVGAGTESSANPSESTKGVGRDRFAQRQLQRLRDDEERARSSPQTLPSNISLEEEADQEAIRLKGEVASMRLEMQRMAELTCPHSRESSPITCPAVEKSAGFVKGKDKPTKLAPIQKRVYTYSKVKGSRHRSSGSGNLKSTQSQRESCAQGPPLVSPTMPASIVKRRTGFVDASTLIAYVIIVCNGDFDRIRKRKTSLTWFEEWFMYLEWEYNRTNIRQQDMEAEWGVDHKYINRVKDCKAALCMAAFRSWPRFASFEEDKELRDSLKWARYDLYRVIQWDMTNIPAPSFADASLYRSTFSQYYGMNCLKSGVGMQLCGWVTAEMPWTGAVEDGDYHSKAGYMEAQKEFQEADLVDGKVVKFHNILDRGYRGNVAAFRKDQLSLQPPSARSDRRFRGKETIYAGAVARDRSGNERGVRVMKRSGLYERGFKEGMSAKRFCDAFLTWGFRANFMYRPIH